MQFELFYYYTNLRALKNFLINYKIEPSSYRNENDLTLSDLGQNFLLFWKRECSIETILKHCKTDGNDVPVVLKVYLPSELNVEAYFDDGTMKNVTVAECKDSYVVKIDEPISFFNVSNIFYVDKPITFLQGDTTLVIPSNLIEKSPYEPLSPIKDEIADKILKSFSKSIDEFGSDGDDDDEEDLQSSILSGIADESDTEKSIKAESLKEDKLIAAYAMFVQGKILFDGKLTRRIYTALDASDISFDKFICDNFYKIVPQKIVTDNIRYIPSRDNDYIQCLKGLYYDEIYSPVISVLLNNNYAPDDKDRFLSDYLSEINDETIKAEIAEIFADKRARNRFSALQSDNPKILPVYFLYTFFDYRLDRFCENLTEFGLDKKDGFANVTLSLWTLLHGMGDLYTEYKNIELLYAITRKFKKDKCLGYDDFTKINRIQHQKDCVIADDLACRYQNLKIEYCYCVDSHKEKICKLISELKKELSEEFDFQYLQLKSALKSTKAEITDQEIIANKEAIHSRFLKLAAEQKPKKSRKTSKKTSAQQSF